MRESSLTLIFEDVDAKAAAMASQNSKKGIKDEKDISSESIIQRGAGQALTELANKFGSQLFDKVPKLWECLTSFKDFVDVSNDISVEKGQEIVDSFTVLRMVTESVDRSLHEKLIHLTPLVTQAVKSKYAVIRYASGKSLATLCKFITIVDLSLDVLAIRLLSCDILIHFIQFECGCRVFVRYPEFKSQNFIELSLDADIRLLLG